MTNESKVVSLGAFRRRKQEEQVMDQIGLTSAERAQVQVFINHEEMDQFIFSNELNGGTKLDEDMFPTHPWTGF